GLHPFDAQKRQAQGAHAGVQRLDLGAQVIGHGRAVGLVVFEQGIPEGRALGIEDTAKGLSGYCLRRLLSMFSTPLTAPVGMPVEVVSGGRAWKARYRYEEPSTRTRGAWLMRGINLFGGCS